MALLRDEFRKLRGIRYFTVLLILLFGANLYICYRGVAVDFRPEMRGYHETVEALTDMYREDPAAYAETRAAMEAAIESYKRTEDEKAAADLNYVRDYRGSTISARTWTTSFFCTIWITDLRNSGCSIRRWSRSSPRPRKACVI